MGTRPEAIKMAPVIRALDAADDFEPIVISTGQHREMLQQVVDLFGLQTHDELDVMRPNQRLAALTARLITASDEALERHKPDFTLVQGDTTSVLAGALASFYRQIPIGHVEAGLRTGDMLAPFPEEANRVLAGRLVSLHFPPTSFGEGNLLREGVDPSTIIVTGNTVIDALHLEVARQKQPEARSELDAELGAVVGEDWRTRPMVLVTGHRRENFGKGFEDICDALSELAARFPTHRFLYPVHLNPNVQGPVHARLADVDNVQLIAPQPYSQFVALMSACRVVLTDSGGVQEEAPGLGKPVLVMRATTERPEGVDAGTVRLVGTDRQGIVDSVSGLLSDPDAYAAMAKAENPYGDGQAAGRVVDGIRQFLGGRLSPATRRT